MGIFVTVIDSTGRPVGEIRCGQVWRDGRAVANVFKRRVLRDGAEIGRLRYRDADCLEADTSLIAQLRATTEWDE